jgi:hypothetical protein
MMIKKDLLTKFVQDATDNGQFDQVVNEVGRYLYHCFEAGGLEDSNLPQLRDELDIRGEDGDWLVIQSEEQFIDCVRSAFDYLL